MTQIADLIAMLHSARIQADIHRQPDRSATVKFFTGVLPDGETETGVRGDFGPSCEFHFDAEGRLVTIEVYRGSPDYR